MKKISLLALLILVMFLINTFAAIGTTFIPTRVLVSHTHSPKKVVVVSEEGISWTYEFTEMDDVAKSYLAIAMTSVSTKVPIRVYQMHDDNDSNKREIRYMYSWNE